MTSRRNFIFKLFGIASLSNACQNNGDSVVDQPSPAFPEKPDPDVAPEPNQAGKKLRFAVCSDGHYGQQGTNFEETHRQIIAWLNAEQITKGLDFIVFNGDIVHDKSDFLPKVRTLFESLKAPYYVTRGNHDMFTEQLWKETWGYFPNHIFQTEHYGFILGNTSNEKGQSVALDITWLKGVLDDFRKKSKVFLFFHIPQGSWNATGVKSSEAMQLIESYSNVCAIFHGHKHEKDGIEISGGKPYIFDGHFGGNWGVAYNGYRIVEIDEGGSVLTFQMDPKRMIVINEALLD